MTATAANRTPCEVAEGVYRIESEFGGRPLYQHIFIGDRVLLLDTGLRTTPSQVIAPALDALGVHKQTVILVLISHADGDHHGGNEPFRSIYPHAVILAGLADRALIESRAALVHRRYRAYEADHEIGYGDATLNAVFEVMGDDLGVDVALEGGERIRLSPDWSLTIVPAPGHSAGHLAVYDERSNAIFMGDAVHGAFYPDLDGAPKMAPNYVDVDAYLRTIARFRTLGAQALHGAHWPAYEGDAMDEFLIESSNYVDSLEGAILRTLREAEIPLPLSEIARRASEQLGRWRDAPLIDLAYSVEAHLTRACRMGRAQAQRRSGLCVYTTAAKVSHPCE